MLSRPRSSSSGVGGKRVRRRGARNEWGSKPTRRKNLVKYDLCGRNTAKRPFVAWDGPVVLTNSVVEKLLPRIFCAFWCSVQWFDRILQGVLGAGCRGFDRGLSAGRGSLLPSDEPSNAAVGLRAMARRQHLSTPESKGVNPAVRSVKKCSREQHVSLDRN